MGQPHFVATSIALVENCTNPRVRHTLCSCLKNKCRPRPLAHSHLESQLELIVFVVYDTPLVSKLPKGISTITKAIHYALLWSLSSCVCVHVCEHAFLVSITTVEVLR